MRLLLIRHGETVDNVAQIYAGTRDSPLTNHGALQALRLGSYLASANIRVSKIFSSDLQRAFKTAESIRLAQPTPLSETTKSKLLREQDFGSYEGKGFAERPRASDKRGQDAHLEYVRNDPDFKDMESKQSMILRVKTFVDSHLLDLLQKEADNDAVIIVAHGIILSYLWRDILRRFDQRNVLIAPDVMIADRGKGLQYLGGWSNTGYLELGVNRKAASTQISRKASVSEPEVSTAVLQTTNTHTPPESPTSQVTAEITDPVILNGLISMPLQASSNILTPPRPSSFQTLSLMVRAVNCQDHLRDLKKTRGGIGSIKYDEKQTTVDSFFKRRKLE